MNKRSVPEHERQAIAAEVEELLGQRNEKMQRIWTTTSLGQACGELTPEAIRKARHPDGVGPAVRLAIVNVTGLTIEQLMQKHGITPPPSAGTGTPARGYRSPLSTTSLQGNAVLRTARAVFELLVADGYPRDRARAAVGELATFGEWTTEMELYRQTRAELERNGVRPQLETTAERVIARPRETPGQASSRAEPAKKSKTPRR